MHETHPPGFINKSDESNNPNSTSSVQNNHTKELKCFSPRTQRLQWIEEYGILSVRRRRNSGWWLCVPAHNLSGDVEVLNQQICRRFFIPRRWEQQYLLLIHCSIYKGLCQEFLQKTGKICIRIKKQLLFGRELASVSEMKGEGFYRILSFSTFFYSNPTAKPIQI